MQWLRKILGEKKENCSQPPSSSPSVAPTPPSPPPEPTRGGKPVGKALPPLKDIDPNKNPNFIRAFDRYGREMFVPREEWRRNVLPGSIKSNWDNPDALYHVIVAALNDGFRSDVVEAANHLYQIDPQPVRGTCVWGVVLTEESQFREAEKVFRNFIAQHGEDGAVLTNLAKLYARRKNQTHAKEILWHALEVDPNQDNSVLWFATMERERNGDTGWNQALQRVATLPGSWRAQIWLARSALETRDLDRALCLYREALSRIGQPVRVDCLMQISGDLGNHGYLPELLQFIEPNFRPEIHGLEVGNNLIKAYVDLGQFDAARRVMNQLYALKRPDWHQPLAYWESQIAKDRLATENVHPSEQLNATVLASEGPVWLRPSSPAAELFPAKALDQPVISFLGSTAETATNSKRTELQMSNPAGRISRVIPLFLAEQVEFYSKARVQTLIPWVTAPAGSFILGGVAWNDADAANYSQQAGLKTDYVVVTHLKTQSEPWIVELRLVRAIDGKCLNDFNVSLPSATPHKGISELARKLLSALLLHAEVAPQKAPPMYQAPLGNNLGHYLLRLEQLLTVRCSAIDDVQAEFLNGEREIINGNLQLCLDCAENVNVRILFAQTLLVMKQVRPDIAREFEEKIALLQKEHPLHEPAQSLVQRLFNEALLK
jgi:tetratricopeptide (TPR) repeat protein